MILLEGGPHLVGIPSELAEETNIGFAGNLKKDQTDSNVVLGPCRIPAIHSYFLENLAYTESFKVS
jgi:hypothetical protein